MDRVTPEDAWAPSSTYGKRLSARELQVVRTLAHGLTRNQAAQELGLKPNTVLWYSKLAYRKLGVNSLVEAVYVLWLRNLWGDGPVN